VERLRTWTTRVSTEPGTGPAGRAGADAAGPHGINPATRLTTVVLGIAYAIAGFHHGFFEALQGNRHTGGIPIASIGPEQVMWEYGTDDAITLIPNFLATGVAAMTLSVVIVFWCLFRVHRRGGRTVFLVGGGIGHIPFFLTAWAYATRMDRPLSGWSRVLRERLRRGLARAWTPLLAASALFFLVGLGISVTGWVPGTTDPDAILAVCWAFLLASLVLENAAYISAFAHDLKPRPRPAPI
jgi:hypothetical protein